jgi:glycogen synthase
MKSTKTKSERREQLAHKSKIKQKKGGTLAGQISRLKTQKNLSGVVKKMKKLNI